MCASLCDAINPDVHGYVCAAGALLCFLNALMCVDSLAHGPLSALSQPMCYMAACVASRN